MFQEYAGREYVLHFRSPALLTTGMFFADAHDSKERSRVIDLDVDIGADAVDYK